MFPMIILVREVRDAREVKVGIMIETPAAVMIAAILRMNRQSVETGHRHGCWVGFCGELGAGQTLTETFMGMDELSVSPSAVLSLRKRIRSLDLSKEQ